MSWTRIVADQFGGPEMLVPRTVPDIPAPAAGEVLVRVEAAGVGYTDTILRRGHYVDYHGGLPLTPGYDLAGTVAALGDGVAGPPVGSRVCDMPMNGAYATYVVRPAECLVPVPDGVSAEQAVQVPLMMMTAWQMLTRAAAPAAGDHVLVVGASGSVGRALVRLARHLGMMPVGTASAANLDAVSRLGAVAIDYRRDDLADAVRDASGGGVAAAFDAIGGNSWQVSWDALAPGGMLVGYGMQGLLDGTEARETALAGLARLTTEWPAVGRGDGTGRNATFYNILGRRRTHPDEYGADARVVLDLLARGVVATDPTEILPLADAAEAHRRIAQGGLDKRIVLRP